MSSGWQGDPRWRPGPPQQQPPQQQQQAPYPQAPYQQQPPYPQQQPYPQAPYQQQQPYPQAPYPQQQLPGNWASFSPGNAPNMMVRPIGLTDPVPCPHCGKQTYNDRDLANPYGGLVLGLLVGAFSDRRVCSIHGVIPIEHFPPAHRSSIGTRRLLKGCGGVVAFFFVLFLIAISIAARAC